MPLTQLTELYTATFGRKMGRVILCSIQSREKHSVPFQSEDSEDLHAVICAVRNEDSAPSLALPETKRRRLGTKSKPSDLIVPDQEPNPDSLKAAVEFIETQTPRVGKKIFQQGEAMTMVQQLFPNMQIKVIESCRGVDRKRELPIPAMPQLLPFRRTFCFTMTWIGKDGTAYKLCSNKHV